LIEFASIRSAALPKDRVRGYALDTPRPRGKAAEEAVEFNGWIVGHPVPVDFVDLRQGDETLLRMEVNRLRFDVAMDYGDVPGAERSGFRGWFDLSAVTGTADLSLVAVFADASELLLTTIGGQRAAARPPLAPPAFDPAAIAALPERGEGVTLPRASIIIPVHGRSEFTRQCLNTVLSDRSPAPRFEVIVVDDASPDDTPAVLAEYGDKVRVVALPDNCGFAGACNAGAAAARGDYLIFLNNDTIPQPGWLGGLVGYANTNPAATVVGAKLLFLDHTVQHAGVAIWLDRYPHHLYAGFPEDHPAVNKARRFQAVTAACCLVRRGAFAAVGGFDRAFVNGWEDVDLCLRLGERGHQIHYTPQSVVYHFESMSRDPRSSAERHNRALYARRWLDRVRTDLLDFFVEDGLLQVHNETPLYPVLFEPSPILAVVKGSESDAEQHLIEQTEQIAQLQQTVADLQARLLGTTASRATELAVPAPD